MPRSREKMWLMERKIITETPRNDHWQTRITACLTMYNYLKKNRNIMKEMDDKNKHWMGLIEVKIVTFKMKVSLDVLNSRLDTAFSPQKIRKSEDLAIKMIPNEDQKEKKYLTEFQWLGDNRKWSNTHVIGIWEDEEKWEVG